MFIFVSCSTPDTVLKNEIFQVFNKFQYVRFAQIKIKVRHKEIAIKIAFVIKKLNIFRLEHPRHRHGGFRRTIPFPNETGRLATFLFPPKNPSYGRNRYYSVYFSPSETPLTAENEN